MSDDLRTRMHHVADEVTPLPVSDDLWRRGQSARHRGQALVVAAVLVVLASVAIGPEPALWVMLVGMGIGVVGLFVYSYLVWRDDPGRENAEVRP